MEEQSIKKTKRQAGWNPNAPIKSCNRCKWYVLGKNYDYKPTCTKNGFRTKGFAVCDDFERG